MHRCLFGLLIVLAAAAGCTGGADQSTDVEPKPSNDAPAPNLAKFLPPTYRVRSTQKVAMDPHESVPVVVVTAVGLPGETSAPSNVIFLAWDRTARRWTTVFDASKQSSSGVGEDAVMFLPQDWYIEDVQVTPVRPGRGARRDVLVAATISGGSHPSIVAGVVRFSNDVASLVWSFSDRGGAAKVTGPGIAPQRIQIDATYSTAVDAGCCPVRGYHLVIGPRSDGSGYETISDDRPWLGATVLLSGSNTDATATVVRVDPSARAAGKLEPGDVITAVDGAPLPSSEVGGLGPLVIDQIALRRPGDLVSLDVERRGSRRVVSITARSLKDHPIWAQLRCGWLGVRVQTAATGGAYIASSNSPASDAGIGHGSVITAIDDVAIATVNDVSIALCGHEPYTAVSIRYVDAGGTARSADVTLSSPPEDVYDNLTDI